jgi:hypothetical protein
MEFVTQNMHIRVAMHNDFVQKRLETHLPGFRLVYFDNVCTVHQLPPQQFHTEHTRRVFTRSKKYTR